MSHKFFDLTFTESVKAAQEKYGSRKNYARFEDGKPDFSQKSCCDIKEFIKIVFNKK